MRGILKPKSRLQPINNLDKPINKDFKNDWILCIIRDINEWTNPSLMAIIYSKYNLYDIVAKLHLMETENPTNETGLTRLD